MNHRQPESKTTKFKKATARIARSEIAKAKYSVTSARSLALDLLIAVAVAAGISVGYVHLMY